MNYIENLGNEEEIHIDLDIPHESIDMKYSPSCTNNIDLSSIDKFLNSKLQEENEELKNQIAEFKNNILTKEKLELGEEIKILNEKNKLLEKEIERLTNNFNSVLQENNTLLKKVDELEISKNCYINQIKMYERELKQYQNKEKKSKKKKFSTLDLIELREKGYSYRKIANHFKVSPSTIYYRLNKHTK